MGRRHARVTQADLNRAWAVAQKAGPDVAVDILPDGTIRLRKVERTVDAPQVLGDDESPRVMF
jgi:hypothetical protein